MIAGLRLDGRTACMTVQAATDTEIFHSYVEQVLLPTLQPGDLVVMDNLAPHKNPRILALLASAGAHVLFLPPYSPDLNPIEKMWSKVKTSLRRQEARTLEQLEEAIAQALSEVTAQDAASWFASCGYSFI